jgi:predicted RNase H-like HicB family nuclease
MSSRRTIDAIEARYTCRFRPEPEGGFTATCAAFPEIVTYGATLEAARGAVREAIELCVEVLPERNQVDLIETPNENGRP